MNCKFGDYTPHRLIHVGQNSCLYEVKGTNSDTVQILKLKNYQPKDKFTKDFYLEGKIIETMKDSRNFPHLIEQQVHDSFSFIVMNKLGPSISELFNYCNGHFSLKTSLLVFDQMIAIIESLHAKNIVHGNIKPNHFLIGNNLKTDTLYLVDFENVSNSRQKEKTECTGRHFDFDYLSTDALLGKQLSWRDDMESMAYILIGFLKGKLPWSSIIENKFQKIDQDISEETIKEIKRAYFKEKKYLPTSVICSDLPAEVGQYLDYCRSLGEWEVPDYANIRLKFKMLYDRYFEHFDNVFDWDYLEVN
jgi:serine/threonine protein kinase